MLCSWSEHLLSACKEDLARQEVWAAPLAALGMRGGLWVPQILQAFSLHLEAPQPSFWLGNQAALLPCVVAPLWPLFPACEAHIGQPAPDCSLPLPFQFQLGLSLTCSCGQLARLWSSWSQVVLLLLEFC